MPYDASWSGLLAPGKGPLLDPARFAGNEDAHCADLARLAYFDFATRRGDLEQALAGHGLKLAAAFSRRWLFVDSQVLIAIAPDGAAWLAFRGTSDFFDLLTDFAAWPVPWPGGGWVHWGFRKAWQLVAKDVADWLAANRPDRIVATGHSLGGAIATLFAADEASADLVTFGCPLVGNAAFKTIFAQRQVRRYRSCCDLVPRVPPDWAIYRQLDGLRYIDRNGSLAGTIDPATIRSDMAQGARDFRKAQLGGVPFRSLADHAPLNYVWALTGEREPL